MNRREFVRSGSVAAASLLWSLPGRAGVGSPHPSTRPTAALLRFARIRSGVSFHFGMGTFTGDDYDRGTMPATTFAPTELNIDQWLTTARLFGARYAILTAKHMSGFCLWPADDYNYSVAQSAFKKDVVGEFVAACRRHKMLPGLYYCVLDPRNEGDQRTVRWTEPISDAYFQLINRQIEELHTKYRPLAIQLIDIPQKLSADQRWTLYRTMKSVDPHCFMMFNQTWKYSQVAHGSSLNPEAWPTDIALAEDAIPLQYHDNFMKFQGQRYYIPLASWIPSGPFYRKSKWREWFWGPHFETRPAAELFPLYRDTVSRNASFCLNLSPDTRGQIAEEAVQQLRQLSDLIKADPSLRNSLY